MKTKNLVLASMFAALTAVFAQITIPIQPIPFTLQVLAVFLAGAILGSKLGFISQIVYLLIGAIGIPVFANFNGGAQILVGVTGGYLLSYPLASYFVGKIINLYKGTSFVNKLAVTTLAMLLGLITIYLIGTTQFALLTGRTFVESLKITVIPFIPVDLFKLVIAVPVAIIVKKSLLNAKLV